MAYVYRRPWGRQWRRRTLAVFPAATVQQALTAKSAVSARARAAATGAVVILGTGNAQARAGVTPVGVLSLLGKGKAQVRTAGALVGVAALAATANAAVTSRIGNLAGTLGLAARGAVKTAGRLAGSGSGGAVALLGQTAVRTAARSGAALKAALAAASAVASHGESAATGVLSLAARTSTGTRGGGAVNTATLVALVARVLAGIKGRLSAPTIIVPPPPPPPPAGQVLFYPAETTELALKAQSTASRTTVLAYVKEAVSGTLTLILKG